MVSTRPFRIQGGQRRLGVAESRVLTEKVVKVQGFEYYEGCWHRRSRKIRDRRAFRRAGYIDLWVSFDGAILWYCPVPAVNCHYFLPASEAITDRYCGTECDLGAHLLCPCAMLSTVEQVPGFRTVCSSRDSCAVDNNRYYQFCVGAFTSEPSKRNNLYCLAPIPSRNGVAEFRIGLHRLCCECLHCSNQTFCAAK